MRLAHFFTLILLGLSSLSFAANTGKEEKSSKENKKTEKEEKNYQVRFAWWELPANIPDLYILSGNRYISVSPRNMSMSPTVGINSEGTLELLKKLISTEKDNTGRPKESYEVYSSINLTQTDSHDVGVLLVPNKQKDVAGARVFDFSARGFPYGSLLTVNFTRSKIVCLVDESNFSVVPGGFIRCPKTFSERTVAAVGMTAIDNNGVENQIVSTKVVFSQIIRTLYFIIENPSTALNRYDIRCIIDIDQTPAKSTSTDSSSSTPDAKPDSKTTKVKN